MVESGYLSEVLRQEANEDHCVSERDIEARVNTQLQLLSGKRLSQD